MFIDGNCFSGERCGAWASCFCFLILAPPMLTLASLQSLPPVGSIDNISVDESFDEVLSEGEENEEFPPPPEDLIPPRQSVRYVNEM
mgnify:CR=1 FL=1